VKAGPWIPEESGLDCAGREGRPDRSHSRQAKMKLPGSNPNGVVQQSPGLARRQPWVIVSRCLSTPMGLWLGGRQTSCPLATTPLGLRTPPSTLPRVVPSVQPWALLHNRVAVEAARSWCSRPSCLTGRRQVGISAAGDVRARQAQTEPKRCRAPLATALQSQ